jgi:hypothetical protein
MDRSAEHGTIRGRAVSVAHDYALTPATVARVRELYPPSSTMRVKIENDRRLFLNAQSQIQQGMILGVDKNVYVEPAIWTIECPYILLECASSSLDGARMAS